MTDTTTDAQRVETDDIRRGRLGRRAFTILVVAFLACAALGVLGPRSHTVRDGEASLEHAAVSRRGLPSPWKLTVERSGGFDEAVEVRTTLGYWDAFQIDDIQPEPSSSSTEGDVLVWTFDPPEGNVFRLLVSGSLESHTRPGRKPATTTVRIGGKVISVLSYRTLVLP